MSSPRARLVAGATGIALAGFLTCASTQAAFTARTSTSGSFTAGDVTISDDTQGSALVTAADLLPGTTVTRCVDVTYTGSLPAGVRLYLSNASGGLGRDLDVRVELGSGGGHASCTGFTAGTTTYWGSAADLAATRTEWASGLAAFDPGPGPVHTTYRFTFTLRSDAASFSQGATFAGEYVWEARSVSATNGLGLVALSGGCANGTGNHGCTVVRGLAFPWEVTVSPDGANVYAATGEWANSLVALARDPATGALSELPGGAGCLTHAVVAGCTQVRGLDYAHAVALSPDGRNVYVTSELDNTLGVYARDAATGALTQLSGTQGCITDSGAGGCAAYGRVHYPRGLVVSPDGRNVYVTNNASEVVILQRDPATGALTPYGCLSPNAAAPCSYEPRLYPGTALTISPDGATVYTGRVLALARDAATGALTPVPGAAGCVSEFPSSGCTVDPARAGWANGVRVTPDGTQLLVTDGDMLAVYPRDVTTGAISSRQQCFHPSGTDGCTAVPVLLQAWGVVASRDGTAVYVSMATPDKGVLALDRDPRTGLLTLRPGTAGCVTGDGTGGACAAAPNLYRARDLAESPDGRHLYVASFDGSRGITVLTR